MKIENIEILDDCKEYVDLYYKTINQLKERNEDIDKTVLLSVMSALYCKAIDKQFESDCGTAWNYIFDNCDSQDGKWHGIGEFNKYMENN